MTITQSTAVNRLVDRILLAPLEFRDAQIEICDLIAPANKVLSAGWTPSTFRSAMTEAVKKARKPESTKARNTGRFGA